MCAVKCAVEFEATEQLMGFTSLQNILCISTLGKGTTCTSNVNTKHSDMHDDVTTVYVQIFAAHNFRGAQFSRIALSKHFAETIFADQGFRV